VKPLRICHIFPNHPKIEDFKPASDCLLDPPEAQVNVVLQVMHAGGEADAGNAEKDGVTSTADKNYILIILKLLTWN
jgi:hypothetical protein